MSLLAHIGFFLVLSLAIVGLSAGYSEPDDGAALHHLIEDNKAACKVDPGRRVTDQSGSRNGTRPGV